MQVIAQRGNHTFLLLASGRRDQLKSAEVRVFDRSTGYVGDVMPALSVIARGYWTDLADDVDGAAIVAEAESLLAAAA